MRNAFTRRRRVVAALAAAAIPFTIMATAPGAHAANPTGSVYPIFLEQGTPTGDPANAITGGGFWGHEGPTRDQGDYTSADMLDGGTALLNAFNTDDFSKLAVAFVPTSADGSAEMPAITPNENLGQAYPYFTQLAFGAGFTGTPTNPATDEVLKVSTLSEWNAWIADGKPNQQASSNDLVMHDPLRSGNPVSAAPQGKSILNRWAAGQNLSLVIVKTTGALDPATGLPIVAADGTGHATAAWMKFTTKVDPAVGDAAHAGVATSGGYTLAVDPIGTTTTLATTPASPQNAGTAVTLSAHVTPASGSSAATGTVQFMDGSNPVGSPVTVDGSGNASTTTSALSVGTHQLTAAFTGTGAYTASSSSAASYVIQPTPATPTSTALAINTGTHTAFQDVVLTATISPSTAAGTVQFKDGGNNLGNPVAVSNGVASLTTQQLGAGSHTLSASFIPTNPAQFAPSADNSQPAVTIDAPVFGDSEDQTITADIDAGSIDISTPYTPSNPLDLGTLALTPDSSHYTGSKEFDDITVTDTRSGAMPWAVTALAHNLTSGSNVINGQNVGLTNLSMVSNTGLGTVTSTDVPAANAVAAADGGTLGLGGTPKTILNNTAGPGTTVYKGTLTLNAPTSTQAGHYTGTVTFTVS